MTHKETPKFLPQESPTIDRIEKLLSFYDPMQLQCASEMGIFRYQAMRRRESKSRLSQLMKHAISVISQNWTLLERNSDVGSAVLELDEPHVPSFVLFEEPTNELSEEMLVWTRFYANYIYTYQMWEIRIADIQDELAKPTSFDDSICTRREYYDDFAKELVEWTSELVYSLAVHDLLPFGQSIKVGVKVTTSGRPKKTESDRRTERAEAKSALQRAYEKFGKSARKKVVMNHAASLLHISVQTLYRRLKPSSNGGRKSSKTKTKN